jgi:hypothetical protein
MKKAIVLLLALMMVGAAFAEEGAAKMAYDLSADATATWGYDLETGDHGFTNEMSFEVTVPIIAADSKDNATEDNVYGQLTITGINLALYDDGDTSKVFDNYDEDGYYDDFEAKIVAGDLSVTIYSAPDLSYDNAGVVTIWSEDDGEDSLVAPAASTVGGLIFGYNIGELGSVALNVASYDDWSADDDATNDVDTDTNGTDAEDMYAFGVDISLTPIEMIALDLGFFYADDGVAADPTMGLTVAATITPVEGLEIFAALDGDNAAKFLMDAYLNEDKDTFKVETYYAGKDARAVTYDRLDLGVTFVDEEGFVPGLEFGLGFFAYELMADPAFDPMEMSIGQTLSYTYKMGDVNYVKPYEELRYDMTGHGLLSDEAAMYLDVGVEFQLFANTVFTADLELGATADDSNIGLVGTDMADAGVFTFACTISL